MAEKIFLTEEMVNTKKVNPSNQTKTLEQSGFADCNLQVNNTRNSHIIDSFNTTSNFYSVLSSGNSTVSEPIPLNCIALKIATQLIKTIENNNICFTPQNGFNNTFYKRCIKEALITGLSDLIPDSELLEIYFKQTVIILKNCNIIINSNGKACIKNPDLSAQQLYSMMIQSFWNRTEWFDIFPSNETAAVELKQNRNIFKDLILKYNCQFKLDILANEFFELTGFGKRNDLFLISFLDFYIFTWLKLFGIIRYSENSCNSPVTIETTDKGRKILKSIVF